MFEAVIFSVGVDANNTEHLIVGSWEYSSCVRKNNGVIMK